MCSAPMYMMTVVTQSFYSMGSPENIANFIGARPMVHQIVLTDRQERPVLWTIGYLY